MHHPVEELSEKGFRRGEPTVRLPECNCTASVICHSFDTKTAKYFLLHLSAITTPVSPLLADSLISHLKQRGQKYNIINLLPLPPTRFLITIRRYGNRLAE